MLKFESPDFFLLIPFVLYIFFKNNKKNNIKIPSIEILKNKNKKTTKHLIGKWLLLFAILFGIVALARPQIVSENQKIKKKAIDIVVALDLSQSMLATDFKPTRIEKAKEILGEFIDKRYSDRLSLVIFGGDAYTKVPLTFDHSVIQKILSKLTVDDITSNNRTAIGMGLGVSINRLKSSNTKSRIIILLTDGENNSGQMSPTAAAQIAKEFGIKIYTIGIGAKEISIPTPFGNKKIENKELDENLLKYIAKETNGEYFRASDSNNLREIFDKIDKLEKTKIEANQYYEKKELYEEFLKISLILLLLALFFEYLIFIKIP